MTSPEIQSLLEEWVTSVLACPEHAQSTNLKKYLNRNPIQRWLIKRLFARVCSIVGTLAPRFVLDVGCGEGIMSWILRSHFPGLSIHGCDLSVDALSLARQISGEPLHFVAKGECLPFPSGRFDLVLCMEVLEHLERPEAALEEFSRVSCNACLISVPHEPFFRLSNLLRGRDIARWGNHPEHIQTWSSKNFYRFLKPHFRVVEIEESFPWLIACCRL